MDLRYVLILSKLSTAKPGVRYKAIGAIAGGLHSRYPSWEREGGELYPELAPAALTPGCKATRAPNHDWRVVPVSVSRSLYDERILMKTIP